MVEPGDGEHANEVQSRGHRDSKRAPSYPDHGKTDEVHNDEGETAQPIDAQRFSFLDRFHFCPRIEPADKGCRPTEDFCHGIFLYGFTIG